MLLFHCLLPVIATDRAHRTPIPTPFCFCPHATRQTRLSASGLPTDAYRYATPIFISHALRETYTQFRRKSPYTPSFAADTAARHPVLPLSTPSIPASGAGENISLRFRFMWNIRLVIRQNLNVYRGFCSFMHIYTLRHCMFFLLCVRFCRPCDPFPVVALRLAIAPRRRSLTPGSASRRVARVPSHRFAFAFSFRDRVSRPPFSISFHLTFAIGVTFALFACTFL